MLHYLLYLCLIPVPDFLVTLPAAYTVQYESGFESWD